MICRGFSFSNLTTQSKRSTITINIVDIQFSYFCSCCGWDSPLSILQRVSQIFRSEQIQDPFQAPLYAPGFLTSVPFLIINCCVRNYNTGFNTKRLTSLAYLIVWAGHIKKAPLSITKGQLLPLSCGLKICFQDDFSTGCKSGIAGCWLGDWLGLK